MTALLQYQAVLLLRSHRWLPPLLLHVAFVAVGVRPGEPVLDSFGWAAAGLLPVTAWLVRVCVTNEPPSARDCAAAVAGPWRVHLAAVLTGLLAAVLLGAATTAVVAALGDPRSADHRVGVPLGPAVLAGLVTSVVCALLGTAVGALCNRPLLRSTAWAVPGTVLVAFAALLAAGSPARAAVSGLVTGSHSGTAQVPYGALVLAACCAAGATAVACAASGRRG
ncbi:ABC transporter [Streptomyces sp. SCA3-4]|uniref:ABC transporter n=1 Tax=Streptomyces sichuanensis TaxID=2871810 RepID=UPI001CE2FFF9|nr:ABC transporter [Streptomyces sichuanensis]MCA6090603.1 ABC transporter [Streptomyces sichuanensis]